MSDRRQFDIDDPDVDLESLQDEVREAIERKRGTRFSDEDLERLRRTPLRPRPRREDLPTGILQEIQRHRHHLPEVGGAPESEPLPDDPAPLEGLFATAHTGVKGFLLKGIRRLARPIVLSVMRLEPVLQRLANRLNDHLTRRIDEQGGWVGERLSELTGQLERRRERDLQLFHNLVFELTDLRLHVERLEDRIDELTRRLEQLDERERSLERLALDGEEE